MGAVIFNQQEIEKLCQEWQVILGLSDWTIKTEICRDAQMFDKGTQGGIEYAPESKMAHIKILSPIDFDLVIHALFQPQDMELSLVHELNHLHLYPLKGEKSDVKYSSEYIYLEQAVEAMAKALIKVKRQKNQ